ncbi:MAG TPA: PSD1 and planctomycete cytochrome C domain-containing protein, partial [Chthonomonadaceae bacterium]|nr:PSD1 and planctomycete cytochrome C domain-containing protein [Chthonomonadaceae bacterium]
MLIGRLRWILLGATLLTGVPLASSGWGQQEKPQAVDFARDVQPLLKAHCFQCHSGAQKQGGLSLDTRTLALKGGASGAAIMPGGSGKSLLVARLLGQGGKPRMPLGFAPLSDAQIRLVRAWIDQGAVWPEGANAKKHWAYIKPVRPQVPRVKTAGWVRNPIDAFVLAQLEKEGLKPSPEADKITLLRRVTLDLTGLPPTPKEVDAFLADKSPNAYERVVDRLLTSPHYGERMALPWLDAARYADSNGFQQDGDTYQYVWRDWVVRAFNADMPFDQFTLQQLAGDLLPNATDDQKLATGFNRCHLLNGEGGAIPEEQRNVILFDRVDVTATTWLGATMACAQCHDHKYDPYTQKDYYSLLAFFNNVPESGTPPGGGQYRIAEPSMVVGTEEDKAKLKAFEGEIAEAKGKADNYLKEHEAEIETAWRTWAETTLKDPIQPPRLDTWQAVGPLPAASFDAAYDTAFPPEKQVDLKQTFLEGKQQWMPHPEWADGKVYQLDGENSAFYLYRVIHANRTLPLPLSFGSDDAIKVWVNGKQVLADKVLRGALPDQEKVTVTLKPGENTLLVKIVNGGGIGGFYFKATEKGVPDEIVTLWKELPTTSHPVSSAQRIRDYYLVNFPPEGLKAAREKVTALEKERDAYKANLPKVMIMSDAMPRKTHILERGNYEAPRAEVQPDTPAFLPSLPPDAPRNRLALAQWLVRQDNPLTARVQVNRLWQLFFGMGLVKTSENLGTQSEPPSHPELLDWLAVTFEAENQESKKPGRGSLSSSSPQPEESGHVGALLAAPKAEGCGWSIKALVRMMVTSATYRQSSKV